MAKKPSFFRRGPVYRKALDQVDIRIAVSGIRGKSSTVQRLHDAFHERGYDTFAKVTGDEPFTLHNGEKEAIERSGAEVTLYENRRLITAAVDRLAASDHAEDTVAIFENHGLTEYTMRVFNETFFRPDVVVMPNIRTDHTDTLGRTRQDIARSFARSIPAGTHVVSGESNDAIHDYLAAELDARDVTISRVIVPERYRDLPGAESVLAVNEVLQTVDEPPLAEGRVEALMETLRPTWTTLRDGSRVFNAAKVNEPESTEFFRRLLADHGDESELVCPLVFLRGDRRGRTATFVEYIDDLFQRDCIDRLHVVGENAKTFARRVDPPATVHNSRRDSPAAVVDAVLAEAQPVITMANTVHPYMRAVVAEFSERTGPAIDDIADTDPLPTVPDSVEDGAELGVPAEAAPEGVEARSEAAGTTIQVYPDRGGEWRWRLVHKNGNILADGTHGYSTRDDLEAALNRSRELAAEAAVVDVDGADDSSPADAGGRFEVYEDGAEEWRWRLRDDDGRVIADSGEGYYSKANARRGLDRVMQVLSRSAVEQQS